MKWLLWSCSGVIVYGYFGYPFYLWLRSKFYPNPIAKADIPPPYLSVIMAIYNEQAFIGPKIRNLRSLDYPQEKLEIVAVSDASTDDTDKIIAAEQRINSVVHIRASIRAGKSAQLAKGIAAAKGEILIFTDARQIIELDALKWLTQNFADAKVGCVSGELMFRTRTDPRRSGISTYWEFEKVVRKLESTVGSVVGASGALYAVRRECLVPPPPGVLLDDLYIPIHVVRQGFRVVFEPRARVWDEAAGQKHEFRRKVRTLVGNYQLLWLAPWLLTEPNPLRLAFLSHKVIRLVVPYLLLTVAIANVAVCGTRFYAALLTIQASFYAMAILGLAAQERKTPRLFMAAAAFVLLNAAAFLAPVSFVLNRKDLLQLWRPKSEPATGESGIS